MLKKILRELINEADITVATLARKTGVPKTNINSWLQGSSPNIEQLDKVAQYFGVSIDFLAFGRQANDPMEQFFEKLEVHKGLYEITVKKVSKKKGS